MSTASVAILAPGQGAQSVGMGRAWVESSPAAAETFERAEEILGDRLGAPLRQLCFEGPDEQLNRTDISQPAIYVCSIASYRGLQDREDLGRVDLTAGLSLGEYTALHLAGAFDFATGLELVATRGRLMQQAAESSSGGMVALIGADEQQANELCEQAAEGDVLVCANFNAPGQIVLSGHESACQRAAALAADRGLRATPLAVAGAFHSPLMQPAADQMANVLAEAAFTHPTVEVWSNVTAEPHPPENLELLRRRLVEQIISPVRWAQTCASLASRNGLAYHELAPGTVLRGLAKRTDRSMKVTSHDQP